MSLKEQGDEHITPPNKIDENIPRTRGTGEDGIPPQYITGADETPLETISNDLIQSQNKNDEDQIPPKNNEDERAPSPNKNGEDLFPPNKKQVDN